jgi:hypothetical protein
MASYIKKSFLLAGKKKLKGNDIAFGKPNFINEWNEIGPTKKGHYDDFKALGKSKWIVLASKGKMVRYTPSQAKKIENTDAGNPSSFKKLMSIKQERATDQIYSGQVELSIVAKYTDGFKILVAGNTRLTAQMNLFGEGWVWQFNVPDEVAELAE